MQRSDAFTCSEFDSCRGFDSFSLLRESLLPGVLIRFIDTTSDGGSATGEALCAVGNVTAPSIARKSKNHLYPLWHALKKRRGWHLLF